MQPSTPIDPLDKPYAGENDIEEILRVVDSQQRTAKHKVATPATGAR